MAVIELNFIVNDPSVTQPDLELLDFALISFFKPVDPSL